MPVIDCSNLTKRYGAQDILSGADLTIRRGERVGMVGHNGAGKSTVGRILAGLDEMDGGEITRRRGATIDYLEQEPFLPPGQSIRAVVLENLSDWNEARQRYEEVSAELATGAESLMEQLIKEQSDCLETIERLGGWEREHEAESIIGHLGLKDPERRVDELSGGERRRVALARLLVGQPDLAILDEPTNHLDIDTIEWLEEYLTAEFPGAVLLITHDRAVLDATTTRTLEVDRGEVTSYVGGYAQYLLGRAERESHAERVERNRQNFLRREVEWLRTQPRARSTKQKARVGRAEEALSQSAPERRRSVQMSAEGTRQGKKILEIDKMSLERGGIKLIQQLTLALSQGERVGIIGPNGSGKTTLLKAILGEIDLVSGSVTLGESTRPGYLDQERAGLLDSETVREAVLGDSPVVELNGQEIRAGAYLERFLFEGPSQRKKVSTLSGGERARVCLAKLLLTKTNLMLLDEPTNDLDVATLGALEAMLVDYAGCVLLVSHDRWFLDRVATSILDFGQDGRLELHKGNYSEYRERRNAIKSTKLKTKKSESRAEEPSPGSKQTTPPKLTYAEKKELEGLFDQLDAAEQRRVELEGQLADPALYEESQDQRRAEVQGLFENVVSEIDTLSQRWEFLEAKQTCRVEFEKLQQTAG